MHVRIASWNIHEGVGIDGRYAPARIARVLAEIDADIVALQEFAARRGDAERLREQLEQATGARLCAVPTFTKRGRAFGNALLSRLPFVSQTCIDLAIGRREPRNAIDAVVDVHGRQLRVIATHLGLRAAERQAQVARLRECLAQSALPTVLLGDFNEWRRGSLATLDLHAVPTSPTFPSPVPVARLDRVFVAPHDLRIEAHVHRSRDARVASDHLPLVATLDLNS
jgi:endonuclease/exonuclease/phosphatase family metal-dependent hydrolase